MSSPWQQCWACLLYTSTFGDNQPLYIIDGFPGDIENVNPQDIQSMEVLKDGAAAVSYTHLDVYKRQASWNAFGMDKEGSDYRACSTYGPIYK